MDHPLDPANRQLRHACVESSEMKNIYDGVVTVDDSGEAEVELPSYFEALNGEIRYQLTSIGTSAPGLFVKQEVEKGRFVIAGALPNQKVSWQLTGNRRDAFARANPLVVEEDKPLHQRGLFWNPREHGEEPTKGIDAKRRAQLEELLTTKP